MRSDLGCRQIFAKVGVIVMDDFRNPEVANFGASVAQLGADATRRACEQGQSFAKAFCDWNTEMGQFLSHRMAQNLDAITRTTKCGNWQDAFSIQSEWLRCATDDYAKQIGKLMEVNRKIVSDVLRPVQEAALQSSDPARLSLARVPMNV
jgi:hypothetical protein